MLLLILACRAPCPTWDDLVIIRDDGASDAVFAQARAGIDAFAAWSGRDGVCVSELRLQDQVVGAHGETFGGAYHPSGWIALAIDSDIPTGVRHELCHATDHQEGWISDHHPELFGQDAPREALAYLCDDGPRDLVLATALSEACDTDFDAVLRFVDQTVYPEAVVEGGAPPGALALSLERRVVEGLPERWDQLPVAAGGAFWALGEADADGLPIALRIAPETARATPIPRPEGVHDGVIAESRDGPLLVGSDGAAWYEPLEGAWTAVPFPAFEQVNGAVVLGGDAWVLGRRDGGHVALYRVDLDAATVEAVPQAEGAYRIRLDQEGLLAAARDVGGRFWLRYSPGTGAWTREEDPDGWRALDRLTLADGREIATWDLYAASRYEVAGIAVRRPEGGDWWLADDPCGADEIAWTSALLARDGEAWLWEGAGGDGTETDPGSDTLARVALP